MKLNNYEMVGNKAKDRGSKWYFKTPDLPNNHMLVEVYYEQGGMNYFSGSVKPRGYYILVKPLDREEKSFADGQKYYTDTMSLFGAGGYQLIEEANRYSQKQLERVITNAQETLDKLLPVVLRQIEVGQR